MTHYAIAYHKGGVGKTVTAGELAWLLAQGGRRVLAIDADQQGQLGARLGIDADTTIRGTLSDVLRAEASIPEAVITCPRHAQIDVLIGTADLKDVEKEVTDLVTALRDTLPSVSDVYDDVVIDTPGDTGDLLISALAATHVLIAPVVTKPESLDQLDVFQSEVIDRITRRMNPSLRIDWILPTMLRHDLSAHARILHDLRQTYGPTVLEPIRDYQDIPASFEVGAPVQLWRPKGAAARAYRAALAPVLTQGARR